MNNNLQENQNIIVYEDGEIEIEVSLNKESIWLILEDNNAIQFESIKYALESGRRFDFEGSMIESIEKYFRSFGAIQKPYFHITKTNSKILKLKKVIKEILK
ncbi:hypothetical protein NG774_05830 [Aliarcobacter cryaerophilus]|uniref:hypothetical protein n=1 Tax=Aliarcobacter cryaerophilus TaxID=28198 RepID=UPI003DA46FE3